MTENTAADFQPEISLSTPVEDYKKLMNEKMKSEEILDDDEMTESYSKIAAKMREVVWKLLFEEQPSKSENLEKAGNCLYEHKMDACFHGPYDYNDWIPKVRDELLKRKMLGFWREQMVKRELGLCWARDSDYFDNMEDNRAEEFYKHAGCVAPFSEEGKQLAKKQKLDTSTSTQSTVAAATENQTAASFQAEISLATPLEDYQKLIKEKMQSDEIIDDEEMQESYTTIAAKMREVVWKLLFSEQPCKPENLEKASNCLYEHKMDACFHGPYDYNDWIAKVRDELLKREMLDFWREQMVKRELGPCWARDSDYFDDMEDKRAEEFYKHAGCVAPFSQEKKRKLDTNTATSTRSTSASSTEVPAKISTATPCEDYKSKLEHQLNLDADDEEEFKKIFDEVRAVIWELLFGAETQSLKENLEKAATTLKAYKQDACFFNPWDYNDWIPKVRDELFARKYFDFWQNVIVEQKLGLCWYKDSDFFDDSEDKRPIEFYKTGDELMLKHKN